MERKNSVGYFNWIGRMKERDENGEEDHVKLHPVFQNFRESQKRRANPISLREKKENKPKKVIINKEISKNKTNRKYTQTYKIESPKVRVIEGIEKFDHAFQVDQENERREIAGSSK